MAGSFLKRAAALSIGVGGIIFHKGQSIGVIEGFKDVGKWLSSPGPIFELLSL
jgi:hypothetical protein